MSGLLALLDDVAAIAKLAATQLDDVAVQTAKAGSKAAGVVIDDAAVTPKYVTGLPAARELPIVWKIARASFFNKLVVLLPAALLIDAFAPWLLPPLLMVGGAYLCFEGAEKVLHLVVPHEKSQAQAAEALDAALLEEKRVQGAIKTDFILSAEIMAISLAAVEADNVFTKAIILAVVAIGITAAVYGVVALLVKADDFGLRMSGPDNPGAIRAMGRGLVAVMPKLMSLIAGIGTAAMLWVGGNIVIHSLKDLGFKAPYTLIHDLAAQTGGGFLEWLATAAMDGVIGLGLGLLLIPIVSKVLSPIVGALTHKTADDDNADAAE
ncbi:MAG: DUF808 domain-containing protein [Myxococcota bacterium]